MIKEGGCSSCGGDVEEIEREGVLDDSLTSAVARGAGVQWNCLVCGAAGFTPAAADVSPVEPTIILPPDDDE